MEPSPTPHPSDETLTAYGSGKLEGARAEAVHAHLEGCPGCRERVAGQSADSFLGRVRGARAGLSADDPAAGPLKGTRPGVSAPTADTLPPGLADHHDYEIRRELGRGGMGVVYLAHNALMGRDEVLKVMGRQIIERPGVLDRFLREIRSVARLRHPNIVTAYSAVRVADSIVFAMEYVEGLDLSALVKAKGPLPVAHACHFASQAALGLHHAHEEGLVHRDIKPANLMLTRKGKSATVKILDFGLAKATREEKVDGGLTSAGQALGTPDFIAPEQILDAQGADIRADIYSLGATLYYLLTGRPPFKANSLYDLYQAHISRDADPLHLVRPEVPSGLSALVAKMMAKDPARRFQTPGEVAQALTPFYKKSAATAPGNQTDVSQSGPSDAAPPVDRRVAGPAPTDTDPGSSAVRAANAVEPTVAEGRWESLIDLGGKDSLFDAPAGAGPARGRSWVVPVLAVGLLAFGLLGAWLGGVLKFKTPDGTIVLEGVPDDSEIVLDGARITVKRPGTDSPLKIRAVPGKHRVEVKTDGFAAFGDEVTVGADETAVITVRLEPVVAARPAPGEGEGTTPRSGGGVEASASHPEGEWLPLFNGKDLTGWKDGGPNPGGWKVTDGFLVGQGADAAKGLGVLVTERQDFKNFRLRVKFLLTRNADAWVAVRHSASKNADAKFVNRGYLVTDAGGLVKWKRYLFGYRWPSEPLVQHRVTTEADTWRVLEIEAVDNAITTSLNGEKVTSYADGKGWYADGGIALSCSRRTPVRIHEVLIQELPAGGRSGAPNEVGRDPSPPPPVPGNVDTPAVAVESPAPVPDPSPSGTGTKLPVTVLSGAWKVEGNELVQSGGAGTVLIGDAPVSKYDLRFEGKIVSGNEGFNALFHRNGVDTGRFFHVGELAGMRVDSGFLYKGAEGGQSKPIKTVKGRWYDVRVRVRGLEFWCELDGQEVFHDADGRFTQGQIGLATWDGNARYRNIRVTTPEGKPIWDGTPELGGKATPPPAKKARAAPARRDGFVSLFNGRNLSGWRLQSDGHEHWSVEKGAIVGRGPGMTQIFTQRDDYTDFHARVEVVGSPVGGAGFVFRSEFFDSGFIADQGYNAQITCDPRQDARLGAMAGNLIDPNFRPNVQPGVPFLLEVIAVGNHIVVKVNGQISVDHVDPRMAHSRGHFGLRFVSGGEIAFRRVEVKEL